MKGRWLNWSFRFSIFGPTLRIWMLIGCYKDLWPDWSVSLELLSGLDLRKWTSSWCTIGNFSHIDEYSPDFQRIVHQSQVMRTWWKDARVLITGPLLQSIWDRIWKAGINFLKRANVRTGWSLDGLSVQNRSRMWSCWPHAPASEWSRTMDISQKQSPVGPQTGPYNQNASDSNGGSALQWNHLAMQRSIRWEILSVHQFPETNGTRLSGDRNLTKKISNFSPKS